MSTGKLSDEAVLRAVDLGAQVHNLISEARFVGTADERLFWRKLYLLSDDFPKHKAAREEMRQEWVRRCLINEADA